MALWITTHTNIHACKYTFYTCVCRACHKYFFADPDKERSDRPEPAAERRVG